MGGEEGDERKAGGERERPAEEHEGNRARPLLRRHDQRDRARGLRRVDGGDRDHDQAQRQQRSVVRRKGGGGMSDRDHRDGGGQQRAPLDPARRPCHQWRADAQHHRAEGHQQAGLADGDRKPARKLGQHPGRRQDGDADHEIPKHQGELGEPCAHDDALQPPGSVDEPYRCARRVVLTHEAARFKEASHAFAISTAWEADRSDAGDAALPVHRPPCAPGDRRCGRAAAPTFQIKFANNTAISPKRAGTKPNTLGGDHAIGI